MAPRTPQYGNRHPASPKASLSGIGNKRSGTLPEKLLICELRKLGIRAHPSKKRVLGSPDIIFWKKRLVVFCDGDFWHGKDWRQRRRKLKAGSNPDYWVKKIEYNLSRDRTNNRLLRAQGWKVIRMWESSILMEPEKASQRIRKALWGNFNNGSE